MVDVVSQVCRDRSKGRRDRFGTIVEAGFWMAMEVVEKQWVSEKDRYDGSRSESMLLYMVIDGTMEVVENVSDEGRGGRWKS
jgi:hypothetical protein